ncbi:glutamyl-tRNA reductase [Almyronema epifaneia]|uniref:Glutamyl-tRNA reductase n=1 Tax=Almyronema epifaneia S1 TaxID=2991925 RepID=A0ABW6IG78_9CYAN
MTVVIVGLSHKTAPVEVREKLSIAEPQIEAAIAYLCSYPHIQEAAILSTCNRLEIYVAVLALERATQEVIEFMCQYSQLSAPELQEHLFTLSQQEAVCHLMQVASGLDSLVLGEGQILAQVKRAYQMAQACKGIKLVLNQLFKQAITIAKRVRTETSICTGAISVSAAAVELAAIKTEDLSSRRITIVGAGKMAQLLVKHLIAKGVQQIAVVNRSRERAEEFAHQFDQAQIHCHSLNDLMAVVAASDIVFTSTAATEPLINQAQLQAVLEPQQLLMLIDISVPRNVAADVNQLIGVYVFNVDDLKSVLAQNQESRRQAALEAQQLIAAEAETFRNWLRSREAVSTISCLREKVETIRAQELEKALSRLGSEFGKKQKDVIEALTRGIVNKILHDPMVQLRAQRDIESQRLEIQTLQRLFNLETAEQPSPTAKTPSKV